jgi:hypothetical protein
MIVGAILAATGITAARQVSESNSAAVPRTLIGGTIAAGLLLAIRPAAPDAIDRLAVLVAITSATVNGAVAFEALARITTPPPVGGTGQTRLRQ